MKSLTPVWGSLVAVVLCLTSQVQAADRYFMIMFASQGDPPMPRTSHTSATFIKTSGSGQLNTDKVEVHTISWLPASAVIEPVRLRPVPGKNFDLLGTIAYAKALNTPTWSWGPFAVKKELYDRALKQVANLNSGSISFIVLDRRFRGQGASNCIHAVADVDLDHGFIETGLAHGKAASEEVLKHLERRIEPTTEDLGVLFERLGVTQEIVRMPLASPVPTAR